MFKHELREEAKQVDPYILKAGKLNGLMIDVPTFPGWKNFAGAASHFKFVRDHQSRIKQLCVVTDNDFLKELPAIAKHFVSAEMRRFSSDRRNDAMKWLPGEDVTDPITPVEIRTFHKNQDYEAWEWVTAE
jgi:hypothetical protein